MRLTKGPSLPEIQDCVRVRFSLPSTLLYYDGNRKHAADWPCDREFAKIILQPLEDWALEHGFEILHLGIHCFRNTRTAGGAIGNRLSNHAYGCAIDWRGVLVGGKTFTPYQLADESPAKFNELDRALKASAGKRLERITYRGKGTWIHYGLKR